MPANAVRMLASAVQALLQHIGLASAEPVRSAAEDRRPGAAEGAGARGMKVRRVDVIAALQDIARVAREKTVARFADVQCDAATRRRLDQESRPRATNWMPWSSGRSASFEGPPGTPDIRANGKRPGPGGRGAVQGQFHPIYRSALAARCDSV